jgi:hypothetical protein
MPTEKKNKRKQIPLRLSSPLYDELVQWSQEDFRSVNSQIEYLLTQCVQKRKKRFKNNISGNEEIDAVDK